MIRKIEKVNCKTTKPLRNDESFSVSTLAPLKVLSGLKDDNSNAGYMLLRIMVIKSVPTIISHRYIEPAVSEKLRSVKLLNTGKATLTKITVSTSANTLTSADSATN